MKIKWQDLAKSRMKKLSMSQEELAELLEVTQGAVGHWLNGRREPSIESIMDILKALGFEEVAFDSDGDVCHAVESQTKNNTISEKNTLSDRVKFILMQEELSQKDLASKLNTSPQTVHNWIKRNSISREAARVISDIFGYSLDWLLSGVGNPKIKENIKTNDDSNVPPMEEWRAVSTWDNATPLGFDEVEVPYYKSIELAAGHGCNGGSDNNGYKLRFSRSTLRRYGISAKDVASFPVHGDSMSPVIPSGSTVFVNQGDQKIVDGGIYFIQQDDLLRIKMLYRQPGKLIIKSYNSVDFPDEEADPKSVKIIGRIFNWSVMAY